MMTTDRNARLFLTIAALSWAGAVVRADPGADFDDGRTPSSAAAWSAASSAAAPASPATAPACVYDGSLDEAIRRNTFMLIPIKQGIASLTKEQARAYAAKNCGLDTLPVSERMNCRIMESCSGDDCVPVYGDHGTAFLVDGGRTLLTAWHVVNESHLAALTFVEHYLETLSDADRAKTLRQMAPSFVLLDRDEKIVYDTRDDAKAGGAATAYARIGNPLSTFYASDGRRDGKPYGQEENIPEDFAEISLTRSLGPGFASGAATGDPAECFVDSGFRFDGRRTNFTSHAGRRAGLTAMMASSGQFMKFELEPLPLPRRTIESMSTVDALVVMGYSKESATAQTKEFPQQKLRDAISTVLDFQERHMRDLQVEKNPATLFVDNPIISGESGGPLLNTNGQVVGLITNGFFYTDDAGAMKSFGGAALRLSSLPR